MSTYPNGDLTDLKALIHVSGSEHCERTVDVILSEGHYQRHLNRLRDRLRAATQSAVKLFESVGAEIFARMHHSLHLWAAQPGVPDSSKIAQDLLPQTVVLAPGRIFSVDATAVSPWSRFNVGRLLGGDCCCLRRMQVHTVRDDAASRCCCIPSAAPLVRSRGDRASVGQA